MTTKDDDQKIINYKELGLRCGLEIHQQLEGKKLFCNCPTIIRDDSPQQTAKRFMRASSGELGSIDIAAQQQIQKRKHYIYEFYKDTNCLIELDEQPPNKVNQEALKTTLQISLMLKSNIVDNVRFMRKTILDGSNTSGFQRTALISLNGKLVTSHGEIGISTIVLEEDAARIIREEKDKTTFRLDRLGIPLIEVSTTADIHSPEHCLEVAETLGMILRSTGRAKRGLGTIRQDVNVSISEGARVEIKGAQEIKLLPKLVELECLRQKNLLEIKKELNKKIKSFNPKIENLNEVLKDSQSKIVQNCLKNKGVVLGIKTENCKGLLGKEVQPNKRFGTELSEKAKVVTGIGGLFHSDEQLTKYGITEQEINEIEKLLNCKEKDAFILVCEQDSKAKKAIEAVIDRLNYSLIGVPKEVRRSNEDGTTTYLRPMPGSARMYPETDIPSIDITKDLLENIKLPELLDEKASRFEKKYFLGKDLAIKIAKSEHADFFEHLALENKNVKPAFISEILVSYAPDLLRNYLGSNPAKIKEEHFKQIFKALNEEEIAKESVTQALVSIAKGEDFDICKYEVMTNKELENILKKLVDENKELQINALIGKAMSQLRGKAQGSKIVEILKSLVK